MIKLFFIVPLPLKVVILVAIVYLFKLLGWILVTINAWGLQQWLILFVIVEAIYLINKYG